MMQNRILIVDDEPANLTLLAAILQPLECEVVQATNGQAALDALRQGPFDLVLLDVMMPVMNGLEALQAIRANPDLATMPVVLVTAAYDREARLKGFEAGADEFLEKPIDRGLLMTRVRTLLRLREAREQAAERARAVEALSHERQELINLIVHDLKSPLSVIHANLRYLDSFITPTQPLMLEALQDATTASERMKGLITDILNVERMDRAELKIRRQEVNMITLVQEVARAHRREAELQNLHFRTTFQNGTSTAKVDGDLIRRVVENLVENALHHTPPHGAIELTLEDGGELAILVSNTGTPIADDLRTSLFEKFTRGDGGSRNRFGLGLYFCKRVAAAHDGSLGLVDRPGWPVSFRFAIPYN